jgi:hypothetical protein
MANRRIRAYSGLSGEDEMIYCVVPKELADQWYDKLREHYRDDPNVEVIIDRRKGERRSRGSSGGGMRELRDRRRRRIPGSFLRVDVA